MMEKVATQMKEIYNKGRTAKNLIPQGLLPDLGWKTDQQKEGRQPLPVEKIVKTTVTPTTPNQVEGPPSSWLQSKTKQLKPSKASDPPEHNPTQVDPLNAIQEVNQVQTASRTGNRMQAVLPLTLIVIWLTIVFLYFRLWMRWNPHHSLTYQQLKIHVHPPPSNQKVHHFSK